MNQIKIRPIPHPLNGTVRVPGSKSLTNRALLIASLANGTTRLTNALFSDDSLFMVKALQALGFPVQLNEANHEITIDGLGGEIPSHKAELFTGNAGTAARFLCAFLTLGNGDYILDGDERMRERPIGGLVEALTQLGAKIIPVDISGQTPVNRRSTIAACEICPPVRISSAGLPGGKTHIAGDISSQYLSALLMIAPYARHTVDISLSTDLSSKPYVDMTIAIMRDFGVDICRNGYQSFSIPAGKYKPLDPYAIESDASAASYFFAAPAICGGSVRVDNISRQSRQGDLAFIDILQAMGCTVTENGNSVTVTGSNELHGMDVNLSNIPDTAQTLAVVAPFATSPTRIRGIASARFKETDRIRATCTELTRLGVRVEEHDDGLTVYPCRNFKPATIRTYHDHRMAMAFALIGLRIPGITIADPGCVSKTFPKFFDVLSGLEHDPQNKPLVRTTKQLPGQNQPHIKTPMQPSTFRLGLTGYPLEHSLSPILHAAALTSCALHGDYTLFPIHPDDHQGLKDLLARIRSKEIQGLNVTLPHKQNVIPWLDELTPTARNIGAVNTIYLREDRLIGDNTDAPGFLTDLKKSIGQTVFSRRPSALILGAGGAARAVVYALTQDGWEVTIAARRLAQSREIARCFENVKIIKMDSLQFQRLNLQLIVNATPIGMMPDIDQTPWPAGMPFPPQVMVYDLVCNPHETKLVGGARAQGLSATTGAGMLVEQAALAFEIWTGCKVATSVLFETLKYELNYMEKP
jgi:3-phosphoshikimate 1-carboxyvinyltransferase